MSNTRDQLRQGPAPGRPEAVHGQRPRLPVRAIRYLLARLRTRARDLLLDALSGLGYVNHEHGYVHGPRERLHFEDDMSRSRRQPYGSGAIYNTRSGEIFIGAGTRISHGCMFLTGRHEFEGGHLKPRPVQVPTEGFDIRIGRGCWIAAGAIVSGGVTIGDDSIVAAGAVVTSDVPAGSLAAGIPARVIGRTDGAPLDGIGAGSG